MHRYTVSALAFFCLLSTVGAQVVLTFEAMPEVELTLNERDLAGLPVDIHGLGLRMERAWVELDRHHGFNGRFFDRSDTKEFRLEPKAWRAKLPRATVRTPDRQRYEFYDRTMALYMTSVAFRCWQQETYVQHHLEQPLFLWSPDEEILSISCLEPKRVSSDASNEVPTLRKELNVSDALGDVIHRLEKKCR